MNTTLVLLPNVLGEEALRTMMPASICETVGSLQGMIAANEKCARQFLMQFKLQEGKTLRSFPIYVLGDYSDEEDVNELITKLEGGTWGLLTDHSSPMLSTQNALLVAKMHHRRAEVIAIPGPASIISALMLSGVMGDGFTFNGSMPKKPELIKPYLHKHERHSAVTNQSQVYVEAPHRSKKILQYCISHLLPDTELSVTWNLNTSAQMVVTKTVSQWKGTPLPDLDKTAAVFIIHASYRPNLTEKRRQRKGRFHDPRKKKRKSLHG